jgi:hypothetical protein
VLYGGDKTSLSRVLSLESAGCCGSRAPAIPGRRDSVLTANGMLSLSLGSVSPSFTPFFAYLTQPTGKGLRVPWPCATLHFSQCVACRRWVHAHRKAWKKLASLQAMSPATERRHAAPLPDFTRDKVLINGAKCM